MEIEVFKKDLEKCVESLKEDLSQIRTGRANPELVEDLLVKAYETEAPLKNYATINVSDARSLIVIPWDKGIMDDISVAISSADMGFSPVLEGDYIRVMLPELTEERRNEYVKIMKERIEDARIAVRQVRQDFMKDIDEAEKEGFSEDQADRLRDKGEKLVKQKNAQIEEIREKKEKELTTI